MDIPKTIISTDNLLTQIKAKTKTMKTTNQSITEIQEIVTMLYSPKVEEALNNEPDAAKKKYFIKIRQYFDNRLHESETQSLKTVLANMQSSEAELQQAIESLHKVIQKIDNMVNTISTIEKVTRIFTRIIPLV